MERLELVMTRPNWRTGAPAGNRNALKSGRYTAEQRAFDRELRLFLRRARQHIAWAKAVWAREALERKNSKTTPAEFRQKSLLRQLAEEFSKTTPAEFRQKAVPRQLAEEFSKSTFAEFRQKLVLEQSAEEFSKTTVADFRQKRETGPPSLLPKGRTEIQDLVLSRLRAA